MAELRVRHRYDIGGQVCARALGGQLGAKVAGGLALGSLTFLLQVGELLPLFGEPAGNRVTLLPLPPSLRSWPGTASGSR